MRVQLQHILLEFLRHGLHLTDADKRFLHNVGPGFSFVLCIVGCHRSLPGIAGHLLHGGVHLVHGRGSFRKPLRGMPGPLACLFDLGRKLCGSRADNLHDFFQFACGTHHCFRLLLRLILGRIGAFHGFVRLTRLLPGVF